MSETIQRMAASMDAVSIGRLDVLKGFSSWHWFNRDGLEIAYFQPAMGRFAKLTRIEPREWSIKSARELAFLKPLYVVTSGAFLGAMGHISGSITAGTFNLVTDIKNDCVIRSMVTENQLSRVQSND